MNRKWFAYEITTEKGALKLTGKEHKQICVANNESRGFLHLAGREPLGVVCPLDSPFRVQISISEICNFRCVYCFRSAKNHNKRVARYTTKPLMDMGLFNKIVEQVKEFPVPPKRIILTGSGEPLCNKHLPEMIKHVKSELPNSSVLIITNGSLLTRELSEKLSESGLDQMLISLQGITSGKYKEICATDIDFEEFVSNIGYLYRIKSNLQVFVKMPDIAIDESEVPIYHQIFDPITDGVSVEKIFPLFKGVDYAKIGVAEDFTANRFGFNFGKYKVCSQSFYSLSVTPDGAAFPCCHTIAPPKFGNVNDTDMVSIWNSDERTEFLKKMLRKEAVPGCDDCTMKFELIKSKEDILDPYAEEVLQRMAAK